MIDQVETSHFLPKVKSTVLFSSLLLIDQISKFVVSSLLTPILNYGFSFGLFQSTILTLTVSVILIMIVLTLQLKNLIHGNGYVLILAGSTSNLIDRVVWGGVVDWIPIFGTSLYNNLADWMIFFGIISIIYHQFFSRYEYHHSI